MSLFPRFFKEAPHWKIAVVSGTADAAVPFIGTQRELECLGRKVLKVRGVVASKIGLKVVSV